MDVPRCNGASVSLGGTSIKLAQLSVFDLATFMGPAAQGLSGALGLDVFDGRTVTLNIAEHQLVVETDESLAAIKAHAIEVPVRLVRAAEGAALTVSLGLPTASGTLWMELDTGNYGPSLVDTTAAPLLGLDASNPHPQQFKAHVAADVEIDDVAVVKPLIMDGNLGRGVLHHWKLTLDLAHRKGWIVVRPLTFNDEVKSMAKRLGS
ncbi:hypothetical protein VI08_13620 [Luteibacter yeojuensis]|uniref:Uncharacterized protein n=2 Tax=Luteibacter yeojuensis TaxID=345309 RepID=A0A0F3KJ99_9GAMM|nr:hypothetical protein VI08_13620 [Luteibacter yeojuensis]